MEDKDSLTFLKGVGSMKKVAGDENEMIVLIQCIRRSCGLSLGKLRGEAAMRFGIVATFSWILGTQRQSSQPESSAPHYSGGHLFIFFPPFSIPALLACDASAFPAHKDAV